MNAIRTIGGSSGGNFPDRKHGNETKKPKAHPEAAPKQTVVNATVKETRMKVSGLGKNIDVYA